jgi:beta-aspartyl-peptidase (threonine type)
MTPANVAPSNVTPAIVVHGGAGRVDPSRQERCVDACRQAARAGLALLAAGGSALDAVQAAVRVLEDDPELNAGIGSSLTRDGTVEVDASIMEGATLRVGAIAAVPALLRPVDLARAVLDDGEHVLLAGEAAWEFARERGFVRDLAGTMIVERQRRALEEERTRRAAAAARTPPAAGGGTVGACAIDATGHVAAATSTGGIVFKRRGRVGDTPLPGCGTYADDQAGAASATGHGESIMRVTLARFAVDRLRAGMDATAAARAAVDELGTRVRGTGGVILIDARGHIGMAHNTPGMSWAKAAAGGEASAGALVEPLPA